MVELARDAHQDDSQLLVHLKYLLVFAKHVLQGHTLMLVKPRHLRVFAKHAKLVNIRMPV